MFVLKSIDINIYKITNNNIGTATKLRLYFKLSFINLSVVSEKIIVNKPIKNIIILYLLKFIFSLDLIMCIKDIKIKTGR